MTPNESDAGATTPQKKSRLLIMSERAGWDTTLHYLHVLTEWPASGQLDFSKAIELGTPGVAHVEENAFFFYHGSDSTLEKLTFGDDDKVATRTKLLFSQYGFKWFDPEAIWVSPTLAFMVDEVTGLVVQFNPATMETQGSFPVNPAVLKRDGLKAQFQNGVAAGNRLFTVVNWRTGEPPKVHEAAALGVFDQNAPTNGPQIIEDTRCASSVGAPVFKENGYLYVVGDGSLAFDLLASVNPTKNPQCVVRMREDGNAFESDFFINLQEVTQSPAIRMAYPMGNGKLLVSMWAPSVPVPPTRNTADSKWFWDATSFEFGVVDLKTKAFTPVQGLRGKTEGQKVLIVDGKNYVQLHRPDRGSILYRIDQDGTATKVLDNPPAANIQFLGRL